MSKKQIILTIDYELFFGENSGTVENSMIKPTKLLNELLKKHNNTMTIFWDILHFRKLNKLSGQYKELRDDKEKIKTQIQQLLLNGHDIQLHIHSHWLDSIYQDGKWKFLYDNYTIHHLSKEIDSKNISTISGCISQSRQIIESVCREVKENYRVFAFRAGGYRLMPFNIISGSLKQNSIFIDSSICYGQKKTDGPYPYDYSNIPSNLLYRFEDDTYSLDPAGYFYEFPIHGVKIGALKNLWFFLLKKLKYNALSKFGDGKSARLSKKESFLCGNRLKKFISNRYHIFTTEGNFKEKINFMMKKASNNSVLIIHPKNLNTHQLEVIENLIIKGSIRFVSIREYLKQKNIATT